MAELTPKEAAELLGVARNTVRLWAESGRLPCRLTTGGHRRFDENVVRQWAELRRGPTEPAPADVHGWRRCADAMLAAAIADLGAGTDAAAPFRAALVALRA
jgi:excisionase family DNA binding protein